MEADNPGPRVMKLLGVLKHKSETDMLSATSGSAQRRKLADISNLLERAKPTNQGLKQQKQSTMLPSKDYLEKLEKEKLMLMKVLGERNEIIRLSGIELQNLRISLHKLQEQNFQLAQANSKMLVELNTNKDRLKVLSHELGCKNGLLKARKLLSEEQSNPVAYQTSENEVGIAEHDEIGNCRNSIQSDDGDNKTCNTKRRRQSMIKPSGNSTAKSAEDNENDNKNRRVSTRKNPSKPEEANSSDISNETNETKENIDSKRRRVRRQSAKFESLELELSETLPETRDAKETSNNQRRRVRRQSARFESQEPVQNETLEEIHEAKEATENERLSEQPTGLEVQASEPLTETMHEMHGIKETAKNSRAPVRRQSTRLKERKGEPIQDLSTIDDKKEKTMKRTSLRRQSPRSKSQEPELSESETMHEPEDAKETTKNQGSMRGRRSTTLNPQASVEANNNTDDPRVSNLQLGDNTALERDPLPLESLKNHGDGNRSSLETGVCEGIRRTSVGRPLRRAAEKIQTYKEISLNVKMRRSE